MAEAVRDGNFVTSMLFKGSDGLAYPVKGDEATGRLLVDNTASGTVTSVSVVSANGFAGTVATATTTPAITISTTITGILKGNGTAISAAVSGTDLKTVGGNTIIGSGDAGTIGVAYGGTGLTSIAGLSLLVANSANTFVALTPAAGQSIRINAGGTAWEAYTPSAGSSGITIGTTTITSGTTTRILYNNAGVVGEYTLTGSGTVVAMQTAPTFATSITTPSVLATANDSGALGASGTAFSDLFLASGGVINWNAGDVTITHSANALAFAGATSGYTFDDEILPSANDGAGLGAPTISWSDLFLASGGVISFANNNVVLTHSSGILTVSTGDLRVTTAGTDTASVVTVGGTQTLSNKTLTAPKFADLGFIADANGNELIIFDTVTSAVNEITLANAATGNNPNITASGSDANIGIDLTPKGTGSVNIRGNSTQAGELRLYEDTDDGSNYASFKVPALAANTVYTLPANDGDASQFLQTNGSGTLSWATASGGSPGWTFVSYTTGTGTSLDVTGLDLSTDLAYKVIVHLNTDSSGTNGSFISLRISGSSASEYDEIVSRNRFTGGSASSGQEGLSANQNWYITGTDGGAIPSAKINTAEILLTRGIIDGTNYRIMARWEAATAERNDGTNDIIHWTGAGFNSGQSNVTELNFLRNNTTGSPTQAWKVWVFKAATS